MNPNGMDIIEHIFIERILEWVATHGVSIVIVILGALLVSAFSKEVIDRVIRRVVPANRYGGSKEAELKRENTLIRIVNGSVTVVLWIVVLLTVLSELGMDIGPLLAAAGVAGLAFGFGGQYLIKDLISGFFIIFENQYRIGDVVCFEGTCGLVEDVTLRATILRDLDGVVHHVPHGTIDRVSNLTKQFSRVNLNIRVSYSADIDEVRKIIDRVGREMAEDPLWKKDIKDPIHFERVDDLAESAVIVKVLGDTAPLRQWAVSGEFRLRIKNALQSANVEIPYSQHTVHIRQK